MIAALPRKCRVCGCTEDHACYNPKDGPCSWAEDDLCSHCAVRAFQQRVDSWMQVTFGPVIAADTTERNHRFLEEALELIQSLGCTASEAHQLVDYVFSRPVGDKVQETGGVLVTLAALCNAAEIHMEHAGELELARIWTKVEQIRAKQAAKPKHSPLPGSVTSAEAPSVVDEFASSIDRLDQETGGADA